MRRLPRSVAIDALLGPGFPALAVAPQVGTASPGFHLQGRHGHWHSTAEFHGYWLGLDFTPGCATEVCTFRDDLAMLGRAGTAVIGVSLGEVKPHAEFAALGAVS